MPLSEHVYCVAVAFKTTERVEQWLCIKFCIKAWTLVCRNYLYYSEGHSYGQLVIGSFITTMCPLMHHVVSCRVFWQNIKSPRWLRPTTAQILCPVTSGFSQNWNHLWKGRDFRPWIIFRKIRQGSWWPLGELCEAQGTYFEWDWGVIVVCTMFLVSCVFFNKCLFFILHSWLLSGQASYMPFIVLCSLCSHFAESFYHKWMLYMVKCFFCIY